MAETAFNRLLTQLRDQDYDRYLTAIMLPASLQPLWVALASLNVELSQIMASTSEPAIGAMRLKWWQEAVEQSLQGKPRHHDVLQLLSDAHKQYPFSAHYLTDGMIAGREPELHPVPFADMSELHTYAVNISGSMHYIMLEAAAVDKDSPLWALAKEAAIKHVSAGIARSIGYHAQHGKVFLPASLMNKAELKKDDVLQGSAPQKVKGVVMSLLADANLLEKSNHKWPHKSDKSLWPLFFCARLSRLYSDKIMRSPNDSVFHVERVSHLRRQIEAIKQWVAVLVA